MILVKSWHKKITFALGRKFDFIAVGLLGGMYIKGDHAGVIDFALEKLKCCNKDTDDLYIKYYIGYALSSLHITNNDKLEQLVMEYMEKYNVRENECMEAINER